MDAKPTMSNRELERLKTKWRGKYRSRQTTWQYLEEIRGPVNEGLRGQSDPDRNAKGRNRKKATPLPKESIMTENNAPTTPHKEATVHDYLVFQPYPFEIGQKLFIESGPRRGDWEVIGLSDRKVRLRCPFSGREVEWDRFCYLVEEKEGAWPHPD